MKRNPLLPLALAILGSTSPLTFSQSIVYPEVSVTESTDLPELLDYVDNQNNGYNPANFYTSRTMLASDLTNGVHWIPLGSYRRGIYHSVEVSHYGGSAESSGKIDFSVDYNGNLPEVYRLDQFQGNNCKFDYYYFKHGTNVAVILKYTNTSNSDQQLAATHKQYNHVWSNGVTLAGWVELNASNTALTTFLALSDDKKEEQRLKASVEIRRGIVPAGADYNTGVTFNDAVDFKGGLLVDGLPLSLRAGAGTHSLLGGVGNTASGWTSGALVQNNEVSGIRSFSSGFENEVLGANSFSAGSYNTLLGFNLLMQQPVD